jgi:hypothetical protein
VVRPLFYRHIRIYKTSVLGALTQHLVRHTNLSGCNLGMFCRSLDVQVLDIELIQSSGVEAVLATLLSLLPRLESFHQDVGTVGYSHMFALASSCKDTLRFLRVTLLNGQSYATSLLVIGQLRKLQELVVEAGPMSDDLDAALVDVPPLELGHLMDVSWTTTRATPAWVSYIARSQFPALRTIRLEMYLDDGEVDLLEPFFTRHPGIQEACLDINTDKLRKVFQMPIFVHTLKFMEGVPLADDLLPNIPVSVRRLRLPVFDDMDFDSDIFDLLSAVHAGQTAPRLEEIHLSLDFDWKWCTQEESTENRASFYGRMVYHAMRLAAKGILVKDHHGTSLKL